MKLHTIGLGLLLPTALAVGCGSSAAPDPARGELTDYCRVATRTGLNTWVGAIATTCTVGEGDDESACEIFRVNGGNLERISLPSEVTNPVWAAETSGALFVLAESGQLSRIQGSTVDVIAPLALDPSLSGDRLVFMAAPEGATEWELGGSMLVQSYSIRTRRLTTVLEDGLASGPQAIPGTEDVLFVSTRNDVAAIFRASPGGEPTQLTNVGMTSVVQEFVPPLTAQSLWTEGGVYYAFARDGANSMVLHLNATTGNVEEVGPGFWPRLDASDDILALAPAGSDPCAFTYAVGGAP